MVIQFQTLQGPQYVRVINKYVHLGVSTSATCAHAHEFAKRKASCMAAMGPIAKRCFGHECVPLEKKIEITRSLLFSRLMYGAGGWHTLTEAETKTFTSATMHVWRRVTESTYQHRINQHKLPLSDAEVIREYNLMLPMTMLKLLRLNLFITVAAGSNSTLKAVVFAARSAQKSWLVAVRQDFQWLQDVDVKERKQFLTGVHTVEDWVQHIIATPA